MRGVEVDATDIYWCEVSADEGTIVRAAPKDGRGPVRTLGPWHDFSASRSLLVDSSHAYWLMPDDGGALMRVAKDGSSTARLPLPPLDDGGRVDIGPLEDGGEVVIVGTHGCGHIVRVPKDGAPATRWPVSPLPPGGGTTGLAVRGESVYCANYQHVHRLDMVTGEASIVAANLRVAGPLALAGERLFLGNNSTVANTNEALMVLEPGSSGFVELGPLFGPVARLLNDQPRNKLFWVTGLHWATSKVASLGLASAGQPALLFEKQDVMGSSAADADYLYWLSNTAVTRLKKW